MKKSHFTYKPSNGLSSVPFISPRYCYVPQKSVPGSIHGTPAPLAAARVSSRSNSSPWTSSESCRHPLDELVPHSKDCPWLSILGIFKKRCSKLCRVFGGKEKLKCLANLSLGGEKTPYPIRFKTSWLALVS